MSTAKKAKGASKVPTTKRTFNEDLKALDALGKELNRFTSVGPDNAEQVCEALDKYGRHSAYMESLTLSKVEKAALEKTRKIYKDQREFLNKKKASALDEKRAAEAKNENQIKAQKKVYNDAENEADYLFPMVDEAARKYLASGQRDKAILFKKFKEGQRLLDAALKKMPKTAKRNSHLQSLLELATEVNEHSQQLETELATAKSIIEAAAQQALREVDDMTVDEMIMSLLPPEIKQELLMKLNAKHALPGVDGIMMSQNINAMVLENIPEPLKITILAQIFGQLAKTTSTSPLAQVARALKNGVQQLLNGQVRHLIICAEVHGLLTSFVLEIDGFLKAPAQTIVTLGLELFKAGVGEAKVEIVFANNDVVAEFLNSQGSALNGRSLTLLAQQIIQNATNSTAIIPVNGRQLTDTLVPVPEGPQLSIDAGYALMKLVVATLKTQRIAIESLQSNHSVGQQASVAITGSAPIPAITDQPLLKVPAVVVTLPEKPVVSKQVRSELEKAFFAQVDKVRNLGIELEHNEKYKTAIGKLRALEHSLLIAGRAFFTAPVTHVSYEKFNTACNTAIANVEVELSSHRGIWYQINPIIRGILGVLAALTLIPALMVSCITKEGYRGTFFSKPETKTAVKFGAISAEIHQIEEKIAIENNFTL